MEGFMMEDYEENLQENDDDDEEDWEEYDDVE